MRWPSLLLVLLLGDARSVDLRQGELGDAPMRTWSEADILGSPHHQNFVVLPAPNGDVFVGNGHGVLHFDGVRWELQPTPNTTRVRSLSFMHDGRLLYGTIDDFGEMVRQPDGTYRFDSWRKRLSLAEGELGDVYDVRELPQGIAVQSTHWLIVLGSGTPTMIAAHGAFQIGMVCAGRYTLLERERGLVALRADGRDVEPIEGGEPYRQEGVLGCAEQGDGSTLFAFGRTGLWRYVDHRFIHVPSDAEAWLKRYRGLTYVALADGGHAFGGVAGGALVLDASGRKVFDVGQADGLPGTTIPALAVGKDGTLWLAGEGGVSALQWPSPLTQFSTSRHAIGSVQGLTRHAGRLVLGTTQGVYVLDARGADASVPRFRKLDALPAMAWHVRDIDGVLWIAGLGGIWRTTLDANGAPREPLQRLAEARFGYNLEPVGDAVYATTDRGLVAVPRRGDAAPHWILGNAAELREIASDASGAIWIGTAVAQTLRIAPGTDKAQVFDAANGLGAGNVLPFRWHDGVVLGTSNGIFAADTTRPTFGCMADFAAEFCGPHSGINRFLELADGSAWVRLGSLTGHATRGADARWHFDARPLGTYAAALPLIFFVDDDDTLWMGGTHYLLRITANATFAARDVAAPRVSALRVGGERQPLDSAAVLPHASAPLRFDLGWHGAVAALPYQFRTRLSGLDDTWSDWRSEPFREVSPLFGGGYQLEVQGRSADGRESPVARYEFAFERPRWARWWAELLWIGAGVALLWLVVQAYASRRTAWLAERNRALEAAVDARTAELAQRGAEIERQNARLRELDSAKSRFFAGISHEFRTPLSLILSPLRGLRRGEAGRIPKSAARELASIERNAHELRQLVDQILEVNRVGADDTQLDLRAVDMAQVVRHAVALFESIATGQERRLSLEGADVPLMAVIDAGRVHRALVNLIGNALKYSPPGTPIAVELAAADACWELCVRDAGQSLDMDELGHVFDLYYRGRNAYAGRSIGSGIGLAFVKAVAHAHHGSACATRDDSGTVFCVRAPCSDSAATVPAGDTLAAFDAEALAVELPQDEEPELDATMRDLPLVLVVDDNPELCAFVAHRLVRRYRVLQAAGGNAALALARNELPDAIISDWRMPDGDGIALCHEVRADPMLAGIALLILAGPQDASDARVAIDAGADDYVAKPFDVDELLARISGLLRARRLLLEAPPPPPARAEDPFVRQVREHVLVRLEDADFGVAEVADALHMDRSALFRRLKQANGLAPVEFIRDVRLDAAHARLSGAPRSVSEVAYACGFESLSYFSRMFRARYGVLPSELKRADAPELA